MCGGSGGQQIGDTPDQVQQQRINWQLWQYYLKDYKPLISKYSEMKSSPGVQEAERKQVAGRVNADVMRNVDPGKVNSNPVANAKNLQGLSRIETGAKVEGQGGVRSRQIGDVQNIIDIGRGQATTAQAGLGELAGESVKTEIANVQLEQEKQAAIENAYGSMAGAVAAGLYHYKSPTQTKARQVTLEA